MQFAADEIETLCRILRWRRDVRHFQTDPVPEPVLERLRATMDWAPSVGNARPWRVIRVEDAGLRAAVRAEFERCNAEAAEGYSDARQEEYLRLKLAGLEAAPVQLAVFTVCDPVEGHGLGRRTLPETLRQSTAMAVHTLWLAARAENLGLGMVSILKPQEVERKFGVPEGWEFSAYLCIGLPEFVDDTPLLDRVGWQKNTPTSWETRQGIGSDATPHPRHRFDRIMDRPVCEKSGSTAHQSLAVFLRWCPRRMLWPAGFQPSEPAPQASGHLDGMQGRGRVRFFLSKIPPPDTPKAAAAVTDRHDAAGVSFGSTRQCQ